MQRLLSCDCRHQMCYDCGNKCLSGTHNKSEAWFDSRPQPLLPPPCALHIWPANPTELPAFSHPQGFPQCHPAFAHTSPFSTRWNSICPLEPSVPSLNPILLSLSFPPATGTLNLFPSWHLPHSYYLFFCLCLLISFVFLSAKSMSFFKLRCNIHTIMYTYHKCTSQIVFTYIHPWNM